MGTIIPNKPKQAQNKPNAQGRGKADNQGKSNATGRQKIGENTDDEVYHVET